MEEFIDYYEILEVHTKASSEVIEKAYKVLAMKYHPDRSSIENLDYNNRKMRELNAAKDILLNSVEREKYDTIWAQQYNQQSPQSQKPFHNAYTAPQNPPYGALKPQWEDYGICIDNKTPGILYRNIQTKEYKIENEKKRTQWIIPIETLSKLSREQKIIYNDLIIISCSKCGIQYHANYRTCPECSQNNLQKFLSRKKEKNWKENPMDYQSYIIK